MTRHDTEATAPGAPADVAYEHLLRGPRHHWWRPLLSILVVGLLFVVSLLAVYPVGALVALLLGESRPWHAADAWLTGPGLSAPATLVMNLWLIAFIGIAMLGVLLGHGVRPGVLHSVARRVRWRWLARCALVLLPLWVAYVVGSWLVSGANTAPRQPDWAWLVVLAVLVTPWQAAGEEYLFRGWLLQSVGSWFRPRWLAIAVPTVGSIAFFALAHGSRDPWILIDLGSMALAAVALTVRTGGLEAAVALHAVNNVVVGILGALTGGTEDALVDETTTGDPLGAAVSVGLNAVAVALLLWQARRAGIARTGPPAGSPPAVRSAGRFSSRSSRRPSGARRR